MQPRRPASAGPSLGHCLELTSPWSLAPLPRPSCVTRAQMAANYSIATLARREKPDRTMSRTARSSVLPKLTAVAHASVKKFGLPQRNPDCVIVTSSRPRRVISAAAIVHWQALLPRLNSARSGVGAAAGCPRCIAPPRADRDCRGGGAARGSREQERHRAPRLASHRAGRTSRR